MDTQTTAPQSPTQRVGAVGQETADATKGVAATAGHEAERVTREAKDQVRQLWGQTRSELTDQASVQQGRAAAGLRELGGPAGIDGLERGPGRDGSRARRGRRPPCGGRRRVAGAARAGDPARGGTGLRSSTPRHLPRAGRRSGPRGGAAEPQPRRRGTRLRLRPRDRGEGHRRTALPLSATSRGGSGASSASVPAGGTSTGGGIPPTATSPASSTASTPTTSGATPAAVAAAAATVPSQERARRRPPDDAADRTRRDPHARSRRRATSVPRASEDENGVARGER